jgi:hypothetical protein
MILQPRVPSQPDAIPEGATPQRRKATKRHQTYIRAGA